MEDLEARIEALEARVARLEGRGGAPAAARATAAVAPDASGWTTTYAIAQLEVAETWIELHEPSARPQLQRLLREVVTVEGPVTDRLALDRIRRAWGLKRAGGRIQEAFEQAVRQLLARGLVERAGDALDLPGRGLEAVRVPDEADEATRRGAEDVPLVELALALASAAGSGRVAEDDLTMSVAKLFGWTRRGGAIQERLDAALEHAAEAGQVTRDAGFVRATSA